MLATFDANIDGGTVDDQIFVVHTLQTARLLAANGDISSLAASGMTITLDPANTFHPGEVVQVTVTDGIQDTGASAVDPHVWQFRTAVGSPGGTGNFSDSGLALGGRRSRGAAMGDVDGDGDLDSRLIRCTNSARPASFACHSAARH